MTGCGGPSKPWTEQRNGVWIARDADGYTLRAGPKKGSWRWTVRPPGAGYDVASGMESDFETAKARAENAYQTLHEEIQRINEGRREQG